MWLMDNAAMTDTKPLPTSEAAAMLDRARQVLELTNREWRPAERALHRRRPAGARRKHPHYGYDHGFAAERTHEAHGFPQRPSHY